MRLELLLHFHLIGFRSFAGAAFFGIKPVHVGMQKLADRNLSSDSLSIAGFDSDGTDSASSNGLAISYPIRKMNAQSPILNPAQANQSGSFNCFLMP